MSDQDRNHSFSDYDRWKLETPDYYDAPDEPECDHEEYEVDWEGRATCNFCQHHWWLTAEQLERYERAQVEWQREYDKMERREDSQLWRTWRWLLAIFKRRPKTEPINDDIPF